MFSISDIHAFKELILGNAAFLHREERHTDGKFTRSQKLEVVVRAEGDSAQNYIALLVDLSTGNVVLASDKDPNPALAVHKLFDATAAEVQKVLKKTESERAEAESRNTEQGQQAGSSSTNQTGSTQQTGSGHHTGHHGSGQQGYDSQSGGLTGGQRGSQSTGLPGQGQQGYDSQSTGLTGQNQQGYGSQSTGLTGQGQQGYDSQSSGLGGQNQAGYGSQEYGQTGQQYGQTGQEQFHEAQEIGQGGHYTGWQRQPGMAGELSGQSGYAGQTEQTIPSHQSSQGAGSLGRSQADL